jgi:hypothetical protein
VIGVAVLGAILIGSGVVTSIGEAAGPTSGAAADPASVRAVFAIVFAAAAAAQAVTLVLILLMRELPLRGPQHGSGEPA